LRENKIEKVAIEGERARPELRLCDPIRMIGDFTSSPVLSLARSLRNPAPVVLNPTLPSPRRFWRVQVLKSSGFHKSESEKKKRSGRN
jgi:hypothetical protein